MNNWTVWYVEQFPVSAYKGVMNFYILFIFGTPCTAAKYQWSSNTCAISIQHLVCTWPCYGLTQLLNTRAASDYVLSHVCVINCCKQHTCVSKNNLWVLAKFVADTYHRTLEMVKFCWLSCSRCWRFCCSHIIWLYIWLNIVRFNLIHQGAPLRQLVSSDGTKTNGVL